MNHTSTAELRAAAAVDHVPVVREILADFGTPLSAYQKLVGDAPARTCLLESVQGGERWGRYSIIGLPARRFEFRQGEEIAYCRYQ